MSENGAAPPPIGEIPLPTLAQVVLSQYNGPEWYFTEVLPQGCFLVTGRPKVGKSWLLLQLAIAAACGGKALGFQATAMHPVLYIAGEDDPGRFQVRFRKYKCSPPPGVHLIMRKELAALALKYSEHYSLVEFMDLFLASNPGLKLIIVDTESTVRTAWEGGSVKRDMSVTRNDYTEVREFDELAHKHRICILLVNHTAKRRSKGWFDIHELVNRTNTALAGASGSWTLADPPGSDPSDPKDHCKVLGIRGRDIEKDYLLAIQQDEFGIFQLLGPYNEHRQTERERELLDALLEITSSGESKDTEGWVPSKQLAEWVGGKAGTIQACLSRMLKAGRKNWKEYKVESRRSKGFRLVNTQAPDVPAITEVETPNVGMHGST